MLRTGLLIGAAAAVVSAAPGRDFTFHKDIQPLLQARCQGCHRPGEAAPMPLMTYQQTRPWAKAIREAVLARKMPPWFADAAFGHFTNDRRLSAREIETLTAWVDGGAKEGRPGDAPAAAVFADGWAMGRPDAVVEMAKPFPVPAAGTVEYTYFLVPSGFTEDKWVENVEVRPGERSVVHHVVVMVRPPGVRYMTAASAGEPYVPERRQRPHRPDTGQGLLEIGDVEVAGVYVPGGVPYTLRPGQARLIPAGSDLIFQMHYTTNGKAALDRTRIGFQFAPLPPRERVINTFVSNRNLRIPAGAADHAVAARVTLQADASLLSLFPHMHVRGKGFEYRVTYPSGETETLLRVPEYDFNWQLTYTLAEPKRLPRGTVIECVARYDNSANNPFNPNAKEDVYWGDQTWEEMLAGFVDLAIPRTANPRTLLPPPKPPAAPPGPNNPASQNSLRAARSSCVSGIPAEPCTEKSVTSLSTK